MLLILLSALAFQVEPRFTMAAEPGDRVRAELFEIEGGLTDDRLRELLGDAVVISESVQDFPGWGRARGIGAQRPDGSLIGLTDAPGHVRLGARICRVSANPEGDVDNVARAARWCASFFDQPVVRVPAPPTPSGGN